MYKQGKPRGKYFIREFFRKTALSFLCTFLFLSLYYSYHTLHQFISILLTHYTSTSATSTKLQLICCSKRNLTDVILFLGRAFHRTNYTINSSTKQLGFLVSWQKTKKYQQKKTYDNIHDACISDLSKCK